MVVFMERLTVSASATAAAANVDCSVDGSVPATPDAAL
jgi:hypothetical protein